MLASRQHVPLDFPAAFPIGDALPGRWDGEWDGEDRLAPVRLTISGQPLVEEYHREATGRHVRAVTFTGHGAWFPAYDGNGNVTGYVDESGDTAAACHYDPYGLIVFAASPEKDRFRHRFSTKPQEKETGPLYYGRRYLETTTGRWINRDPIGERGGVNLYGFIGNDGVNTFDFLGLKDINVTIIRTYLENETIGSLPIVSTDERAARCCGTVTGAALELPRGRYRLVSFSNYLRDVKDYPIPEGPRDGACKPATKASAETFIDDCNRRLDARDLPRWVLPHRRIANYKIDVISDKFRDARMHAGWSCLSSRGCPIVGPEGPTLSRVTPRQEHPGARPEQVGVEIEIHTFDYQKSIAKQMEIGWFVDCVKGVLGKGPEISVDIRSQ